MTSAASQVKVIVVDDDDDLRRLVSIALELDGRFEVVATAATAKAAVQQVAQFRPDAVLLDLTLPDVPPDRGLDMVAEIHGVVPECAVVVFTGSGDEQLEARVLAAGGSALVTKGSSTSAFIDALLVSSRLWPGAPVAVRSTFDGAWQRGFFVAGEDDRGYWLQRGDGSTLSGPVDHERVRPPLRPRF